MKRLLMLQILVAVIMIFSFSLSAVAGTRKAIILPFAINGPQSYKYLEKSIPQMFSTRLHWPEHIDAMLPESDRINSVPENESQVRQIIRDHNLDYAVWGSMTVIGEECSLDVRVLDKNGALWTKSRENRVDQLIPVLSGVADNINTEVFKRNSQMAQNMPTPRAAVVVAPVTTQSAPSVSVVPDGGGLVSVEPENSGSLKMLENKNDDRYISQQLNIASLGMSIADLDEDGRDEIVFFNDHNLFVYHFEQGRLISLGNTLISRILYNVALNVYDFGPGVGKKLVLSAINLDNEPRSFIIGFKNRKLSTEISGINYFLNVVKDAEGNEKLLGQPGDHYDMFRENAAFEAKLTESKLVEGAPFPLLPRLNIYNFAYLPGKTNSNDPTRVVRINNVEKLELYSPAGAKLYESGDDYSGAPAGIEINPTFVGFGDDTDMDRNYYYIPLAMPVCDLDGDGRSEVIVNKPVTFLGKFFGRYRSFVESEVYCMFWDGIGMSPQWKTPILGGSVAGVALADLDRDGVMDLVLCLNAAGSTVFHDQKTTIVGFPLRFNQTSNTK